jgi:uncharacterized oxidoreductase
VQTDLLNSRNERPGNALAEFIDETMKVLGSDAGEVLVERAKILRKPGRSCRGSFIKQFNDSF